MYDVFVIKGNTAVFKCQIPSFVSDHVEVISWQDTANGEYLPPKDNYGSNTCCSFSPFCTQSACQSISSPFLPSPFLPQFGSLTHSVFTKGGIDPILYIECKRLKVDAFVGL